MLPNRREQIKKSVIHRLIIKFHDNFIERFLPHKTQRRYYYDLGLTGGRIIINEGIRSFWWALKRYVHDNYHISQERKFYHTRDLASISNEKISINPEQFLSTIDLKIAVHAHIYYIEIFEEIYGYLENIPVKFSLFISVKNIEDKKIVIEKIKKLPLVEYSDIRVVINRGRDIAPFIVEFGALLKNYDIICHIHTKKSLFTGEEKFDWRKYLLNGVLGSKNTVNAILTLFKMDSSIGIIYPEIWPHLPYQACTWLSNKAIAPTILKKLNIRYDPDEYFDFPAGSMFWIRREALEPILNLGLTINDFPEEAGQNDGALQHTIERCFVLAAQSRGFKYLVLQDPDSQQFSFRSHRNLKQYFGLSFENKFLYHLSFSEILSFDIFDTLLIRPFATPNMVFSYLEERVAREFGIFNFEKLRIKAESIARKRKNYQGDVKISEIYSIFSELAQVDLKTADKLLQLEVATEKTLLIPRNAVIEKAKYAKSLGKRLILVSDTYLERKYIEEILCSKSIDFFDEIYLSCEIGKRKDRGDLWDHVFECEKIRKDNFTHIGDNEQSDVQMIGDNGFIDNLVHVMRPTALFRNSEFGRRLWDFMKPYNGWRENLLYGTIGNFYCNDPEGKNLFCSTRVFEDLEDFGYVVFGPIIYNFLNWLIKTSIEDECNQLWFTSREGYLLNSAFETIVNHPNFTHLKDKIPASKYILCSRRAAIFALLKTESDIPRLLEGKFKGSLRDFLTKRLNITNIISIEARIGTESLDKYISLPEDYDRIVGDLKRVLDILVEDAEIERKSLIEYFKNQGFDGSNQIAIVDIGYSGTIQSALAELLHYPIKGYYFVTETKASKLLRSGLICKGYFGELIDPYRKTLPIHRYSLLLEAVLTAPTGQLVRFGNDDSTEFQPVFKEPGVSQKEFSKINQIHKGILKYIHDMIEEFGPPALDIELPKDLVQTCFEQVINGNLDIGSIKSILLVEDDFCGNNEISVIDLYKGIVVI